MKTIKIRQKFVSDDDDDRTTPGYPVLAGVYHQPQIWIDGQEVTHVQRVELVVAANDVPMVTVVLFPDELDIEIDTGEEAPPEDVEQT